MKIIVLNQTPYQEKDTIITAISEDQLISFKVRGGQNPTSQHLWLNNVLTIADVEFIENPRYQNKILKSAKLIASPFAKSGTYDNMLAIQLISEIMREAFMDEDKPQMFFDLEAIINCLYKENDYLLAELVFLNKVCEVSGFAFETSKCVSCGSKKDIVAFSFEEGGFVCRECFNNEITADFSANQLQIIRYITNVHKYEGLANEKISKADKLFIMQKYAEFIRQSIGVHLNAIELILKN